MLSRDVRFHPDEALYTTFARRVALHGDFLLSDAPLDKPPLLIFAIAASDSIFGATEFAARLPSFFASLLTLAFTYALTRRIYGKRIGLWVVALLALSPFDLAFAGTAFLDPLLTCFFVGALWLICTDRWRGAGLLAGFAIATKQSALQFIPLILAFGLVYHPARREFLRGLRRFALPILAITILLVIWSIARAAPTDFWTLGIYNNNPGRLIRDNEVLPRLMQWIDLLSNVTGFAPVLLIGCIPLVSVFFLKGRSQLFDVMLLTYVFGSLFAYWLIAFNIYDRYLLPLVPLILILVARGVDRLPYKRCWMLIIMISMLPAAQSALHGDLTIGGDHGTYRGIDEFAMQLNTLTGGKPIYEHWLGWELGYYLGDHPLAQLIWQPTPQAMLRAGCGSGNSAYFAAPENESAPWLAALQSSPIRVTQVIGGSFELYRLDWSP